MSYLLAIIGLAVLILVHEAGHMWVARLCGMRVEKFSIFFGPALLSWRGKHTTYQLASIPLGGYVQIAGMGVQQEVPPDDPGSYQNKPAWMRFLTVFAGPAVNYLLASLIVITVALGWGVPVPQLAVGQVALDSPAAAAGMRSGDVIRTIEGHSVRTVEQVVAAIVASEGKALRFGVQRQGDAQQLVVTPRVTAGGNGGQYRIGIHFGTRLAFEPATVVGALWMGVYYPAVQTGNVLEMLKRLFTRKVSAKQVGGPIEIVHQIKMSFQGGVAAALLFLAMINIYLGLFNLLPIPALDGGRLAFLTAEMVSRRRISHRFESIVHTIGFILLLALLLLVTYGDIRRRF